MEAATRQKEPAPRSPAAEAGRDLALDLHGPPGTPAVLFLHGITGSRHYWAPAVPRLAGRRRLLLPDLLGFGASPKPPITHDLDAHVEAVRARLRAVPETQRPFSVVAHSLGGLIALEWARRHPGAIDRAVLFSLPCHRSREDAHRHFLAGSVNYRRLVGAHSWGATLRSWVAAGPGMALRYLFAFSPRIAADSRSWTLRSLTSTIEHCLLSHRVQDTLDALERLPERSRPRLLLVHGARDQVTPLSRVQEVAANHDWIRLAVVPGTGHHPFRTHRSECLRRVESVLGARPDDGAPS